MESNRIRVALVEDHVLMQVGVAQICQSDPALDYRGSFSSVSDALANVQITPDSPEPLDVLLLDLRLEGVEYDPAGAVIQGLLIATNVLIYTGGDDPYGMRKACEAGAAGIVRKASSPETLLAAIHTVHCQGAWINRDWVSIVEGDAAFFYSILTEAEREILAEYAQGLTAQQVAHRLGRSVHTVNSYLRDIRSKYGKHTGRVLSRVDLFKLATRSGLIPGVGL